MTRLMVCVASVVCSVEKTRWPVSAALSAVSSVSLSRISPIRMTSGSCRSTDLSAAWNERVSVPTSRWEMFASWSRCRNSIGSSIVMMLTRSLVLTWLIIAASAVDFPEPVTPVTSTRPRGLTEISSRISGSLSSLTGFTSYGMARNAKASVPRCWYTLVRKRPTPGTPMAKSASFRSAKSFTCRGVMICSASVFSSSGFIGAISSGVRSPLRRMVGGRPTFSRRSEPPRCTICEMAPLKLKVLAAAAGAAPAASAIGIHPEEDLAEFDRRGLVDTHFLDHTGDLGLDLVHDLHRLDDADHLPRLHPRPHLGVRRGPRLGGTVEGADHRRLDLFQ